MKNYFRNLAVITGLTALFGSSVVLAQSGSEKATVPFAFHASAATLPAGNYTVAVANGMGVLQISDAATGHSIMLGTRTRESSKDGSPRLTFHRYGNEYFLAEIWMPDQVNGYKLATSAREKEMSKQSSPVTLASIRLVR
jgi:hypothetical protein